ncbi:MULTISPECIES: TetR/AcrR family transcriptional regulator [unclassified Bradyrhizobium]|uniref:TetR/AcrR family transcriptional regulator n=1 Tax=unclassified Bradyrhizobium TaxID=2631580 RepID=UPI0029167A53|nr:MULTISPECIES: TetR/AcrR family transcriptional regulator [unclassified Bradyrhizobium]
MHNASAVDTTHLNMDIVHIEYPSNMDAVNMRNAKTVQKAYHHGNLAQVLLDASQKLLDEGGIDAVTVRAVAREAGVAHSAPANHFKDRDALLGALAARIFEELVRQVKKALAGAPSSSREGLHAVAKVIVGYALQHPNRYRLLWRSDNFASDKSAAEAAGTVLYDLVKSILSADAATAKASIDSQVIAAWSLIHGYVSLRLEGTIVDARDERSGKSRATAIVDVLIEGLGRT